MKLSRIHHVPYERLNNRLKGKHPIRYGSVQLNIILTPAQEAGMVQYMNFLDIYGDKARRAELSIIANRILYNDDQIRLVSHHFGPRFLERYPKFLVRK